VVCILQGYYSRCVCLTIAIHMGKQTPPGVSPARLCDISQYYQTDISQYYQTDISQYYQTDISQYQTDISQYKRLTTVPTLSRFLCGAPLQV
jgi:hypothetical protein